MIFLPGLAMSAAFTGTTVTHYSAAGVNLGVTVPGLINPVSVTIDNAGRLMVCDNGTYQVKFFTLTGGTPVLATTFGTANGILSGTTPGALGAGRLFNLVGAGTDSSGNIYLGDSFASQAKALGQTVAGSGNTHLTSYTASGTQNWSIFNGSYVENFAFDPTSDGQTVFSASGIYNLNYNNTAPGSEATLQDVTIDTLNYPADSRVNNFESVQVRYPTSGQAEVFTMNQYGNGMGIYTFATAGSKILSHALSTSSFTSGTGEFAWDVDSNGGIWDGDASGHNIYYYPFQSWSGNVPVYSSTPTIYAWPPVTTSTGTTNWSTILKVKYIASTDTLYVGGLLSGQTQGTGAWGTAGASMACYSGWMHGTQTQAWLNSSLPTDAGGVVPKGMDIAGNYVFLATANAAEYSGGPHAVHILNAKTGAYVGSLVNDIATGSMGETVDTLWSVTATERSNGEYEVMVEDDGKGKQLLYRWDPNGPIPPASTAPTITAQPMNQTVILGQAATFSVTGAGSPTLTYQWTKNGAVISGATQATYTTPATTSAYNGVNYNVKITNAYGNVTSSSATLSVLNPSSAVFVDVSNSTGTSGMTTLSGTWTQSTSDPGYYGTYYLTDGNSGAGKSVTFTPNLSTTQNYEVFVWWVANTNRATNVPISVTDANGTTQVRVDERVSGSQWVSLGSHAFISGTGGSVTISDTGANDYAIADAVCFVPEASQIVDVSHSSGFGSTTLTGTWTQSANIGGYYGSYFLYDSNTQAGKSVQFTPNLPSTGDYEVFALWVSSTNRALNVPISIATANGTVSVPPVNQQINSGQWVSLGTYSFNSGTTGSVTILDSEANGQVIANAVQFLQRW